MDELRVIQVDAELRNRYDGLLAVGIIYCPDGLDLADIADHIAVTYPQQEEHEM